MRYLASAALVAALAVCACSDAEKERIKDTTKPTYDKTTGRLTQLTYDRDKNGVIDTWTDMDGTRPLRSRIDMDEDGKIDRWEYYDDNGKLLKVGFSRKQDGKPDAWAFAGPDGKVARIEISSTGDEKKIDRWEYYDASRAGNGPEGAGALVRAEVDTLGDGKPHQWETYENGVLKTAEFDEDGDGRPDRRMTYTAGALTLIESARDASGHYTKRVVVK